MAIDGKPLLIPATSMTKSGIDLDIYDCNGTQFNSCNLNIELVIDEGTPSPTHPISLNLYDSEYIDVNGNLYNKVLNPVEQGTISSTNGTTSDSTTRLRTSGYTRITGSNIYTVLCNLRTYLHFYDATKTFISGQSIGWKAANTSYTFTAPSNARYVKLVFSFSSGSIQPSDFSSLSITGWIDEEIDWFSQAGYVAAGNINLLTGVLTVTQVGLSFDGTESWSQTGTAGTTRFFRYIYSAATSDVTPRGCTHYENATITTSSQTIGYYAYTSGSRTDTFIQFRPDLSQIANSTAWKNFLATEAANGHAVQCYFTPKTPMTYQLTNYTPIDALFGKFSIYGGNNPVVINYNKQLINYLS